LSRRWLFVGRQIARVCRKLGIHVEIPQVIPLRFTEPAAEAQLVQWGVSIVRQRYQSNPTSDCRRGADMAAKDVRREAT
jgi:hypothetical protein